MLLPYELGEFAIAAGRVLRQAWAGPLDQREVVLVDGGGWHLGKTRLVGKGLLVSNKQAHPWKCQPCLERPSWTTVLPLPWSFLLPEGEKCGAKRKVDGPSQSGSICQVSPPDVILTLSPLVMAFWLGTQPRDYMSQHPLQLGTAM